jgi:hypothetical protein
MVIRVATIFVNIGDCSFPFFTLPACALHSALRCLPFAASVNHWTMLQKPDVWSAKQAAGTAIGYDIVRSRRIFKVSPAREIKKNGAP